MIWKSRTYAQNEPYDYGFWGYKKKIYKRLILKKFILCICNEQSTGYRINSPFAIILNCLSTKFSTGIVNMQKLSLKN